MWFLWVESLMILNGFMIGVVSLRFVIEVICVGGFGE